MPVKSCGNLGSWRERIFGDFAVNLMPTIALQEQATSSGGQRYA